MEAQEAQPFAELWAKIVAAHGQITALETVDQRLSYEELDASARAVAKGLVNKATWRAGARIGLEVSRPGFFGELIGVWLAGGVPVPLREAVLAKEPALQRLIDSILEGRVETAELSCKPPLPGEDSWHAIFFTSGSTGEPKAVVRGWRQAYHEARCYAELLGLAPGMRTTMLIDPVFGASTKHFLGCLLSGCHQSFGSCSTRAGHVLYGTPAQVVAFAKAGSASFEWVSLTGEACSLQAWQAAAGATTSNGKILNALGGSEFGVAANQILSAQSERPTSFCGVPIRGKTLEVTDEAGSPLESGEAGLLRVASQNLAEGYLVPCADRVRLEPFPERAGYRFFSTGDVGWIDRDGHFHYVGRAGKMQKRGGRWIDTTPLRRILESCEGLRDFLIDWPAGSLRPLVWCAIEKPSPNGLESISSRILGSDMPEHLVPVELRGIGQFPRNRHGKTDLTALNGSWSGEKVDFTKLEIPGRIQLVADALERSDTEALVFRGVQSLASFGFDSLSMHELAARLSERTGHPVSPATLLADVPIAALAAHLRTNAKAALRGSEADAGRPLLLWFGDGLVALHGRLPRTVRLEGVDYERATAGYEIARVDDLHRFAEILLESKSSLIGDHPVVVGGFSFGSLLAHEAGIIFRSRNVPVEGVFLVDPPDLAARAIRTPWRWSRWKPWIWIAVLAPFRRVAPAILQKRLSRELRLLGRERRRDWMRKYRPTPSDIQTTLLCCRAHLEDSAALFGATCRRLKIHSLPAETHLDVLRETSTIEVWTNLLAAGLERGGITGGRGRTDTS